MARPGKQFAFEVSSAISKMKAQVIYCLRRHRLPWGMGLALQQKREQVGKSRPTSSTSLTQSGWLLCSLMSFEALDDGSCRECQA
ncbi:hypothetical protein ALQ48_200092 [Pseudomonas coronafaciens pv. zizaniae]|nr:hypothetical protein ALQ48_200092 [Pseudomonas coronafaciens pv. zizaniae]